MENFCGRYQQVEHGAKRDLFSWEPHLRQQLGIVYRSDNPAYSLENAYSFVESIYAAAREPIYDVRDEFLQAAMAAGYFVYSGFHVLQHPARGGHEYVAASERVAEELLWPLKIFTYDGIDVVQFLIRNASNPEESLPSALNGGKPSLTPFEREIREKNGEPDIEIALHLVQEAYMQRYGKDDNITTILKAGAHRGVPLFDEERHPSTNDLLHRTTVTNMLVLPYTSLQTARSAVGKLSAAFGFVQAENWVKNFLSAYGIQFQPDPAMEPIRHMVYS